MDASTHRDRQTGRAARYKPVPRTGPRRGVKDVDTNDAMPPADVAQEVGEAARQLGDQLSDTNAMHSLADIERIVAGLAAAVTGAADGLDGITQWLRSTGYGGDLSGHASVVAERLAHAGGELGLLVDAVHKAAGEAE
ncbi:hypothetical protein UA75_11665 [Actinoalloteichus sp. GBA129-24]|nr:hypothetical protein UA74_11580 [Actinoalloteichus fjordicus]APU20345.1 hypothetical protein UA75_11665 [Actinoalloteichus sp. GBA129-24]